LYEVLVASFLGRSPETHSPSETGFSIEFRALEIPFVTPVELVRGGIGDGLANDSGNIVMTIGLNAEATCRTREGDVSRKERSILGEDGG
jgi:hypothetical protein